MNRYLPYVRLAKEEKSAIDDYFSMHHNYYEKTNTGLVEEDYNPGAWITQDVKTFENEISNITLPYLNKQLSKLRDLNEFKSPNLRLGPAISITKSFKFDACHFLPYHNRRCKFLHGHCWQLDITVKSIPNPNTGMVMDYSDLKHEVMEVLDKWDHGFINEQVDYPTSELMLYYIWANLQERLERFKVSLEKIRLYETEDSYAELTREDIELWGYEND